MNLLDSTIVNVAAPAIQRDLSLSTSALEWVAMAAGRHITAAEHTLEATLVLIAPAFAIGRLLPRRARSEQGLSTRSGPTGASRWGLRVSGRPVRGRLSTVLGLPDSVRVCLFDLDGVLTDTASVHRAAWKDTFDPVLERHGQSPFTDDDYAEYVDGKPRLDGTRDFLKSRNLDIPEGGADDGPDDETVHGIAAHKNDEVLAKIKKDGVKVYPGSKRYLEAAKDAGLRRIVVSSSANTQQVLQVTGLDTLVEGRVDGKTIDEQGLKGKPAPDSFLAGAKLVDATPDECVVFEDATSGVAAGHSGRFGYVVGVNRLDDRHAADLSKDGASVVVDDLADLLDDGKAG